ncbi:hypothetical protein [Maridesulfovibrio frigidus]|uniref:hypothetical protein n=1 Tax=Maridesulfovibrio frigidus TaxID=340956 RepID=UPI0012EB90E0|nr:hypothetical protein [Maridesulfovibrio frigidus]
MFYVESTSRSEQEADQIANGIIGALQGSRGGRVSFALKYLKNVPGNESRVISYASYDCVALSMVTKSELVKAITAISTEGGLKENLSTYKQLGRSLLVESADENKKVYAFYSFICPFDSEVAFQAKASNSVLEFRSNAIRISARQNIFVRKIDVGWSDGAVAEASISAMFSNSTADQVVVLDNKSEIENKAHVSPRFERTTVKIPFTAAPKKKVKKASPKGKDIISPMVPAKVKTAPVKTPPAKLAKSTEAKTAKFEKSKEIVINKPIEKDPSVKESQELWVPVEIDDADYSTYFAITAEYCGVDQLLKVKFGQITSSALERAILVVTLKDGTSEKALIGGDIVFKGVRSGVDIEGRFEEGVRYESEDYTYSFNATFRIKGN